MSEHLGGVAGLDSSQASRGRDTERLTTGEHIVRAGGVDDGTVGRGGQSRHSRAFATGGGADGEAIEVGHCDDISRVVTGAQELGGGGEAVQAAPSVPTT